MFHRSAVPLFAILYDITMIENLSHTKYIGFRTFAKTVYFKVPYRAFLNVK